MNIFSALFCLIFQIPTDGKTDPIKVGSENMINNTAKIIKWDKNKGQVEFEGETWNASSKEELLLNKNDTVTIKEINKLNLTITA